MGEIKEVLLEMAEAGHNTMFDEKFQDLQIDSIVRAMWLQVAFNMLSSVKFPLELIKICRELNMMGHEERKEFIEENKEL